MIHATTKILNTNIIMNISRNKQNIKVAIEYKLPAISDSITHAIRFFSCQHHFHLEHKPELWYSPKPTRITPLKPKIYRVKMNKNIFLNIKNHLWISKMTFGYQKGYVPIQLKMKALFFIFLIYFKIMIVE